MCTCSYNATTVILRIMTESKLIANAMIVNSNVAIYRVTTDIFYILQKFMGTKQDVMFDIVATFHGHQNA